MHTDKNEAEYNYKCLEKFLIILVTQSTAGV